MDVIYDFDLWRTAGAKLFALGQAKLPVDLIEEENVDDFHEIISLFEKAIKKDLSAYRLDRKRFRTRPYRQYGVSPIGWTNRPMCPTGYFSLQYNAFFNYIQLFKNAVIEEHKNFTKEMDEWKEKMGLKPKQPDNQPSPFTVNIGNMNNSNFMANSPGAIIINKVQATSPEFDALIKKIKDAIPNLEADPTDKKQLTADVVTIETQLESPAPKYSVISESFSSIRAILGGSPAT